MTTAAEMGSIDRKFREKIWDNLLLRLADSSFGSNPISAIVSSLVAMIGLGNTGLALAGQNDWGIFIGSMGLSAVLLLGKQGLTIKKTYDDLIDKSSGIFM